MATALFIQTILNEADLNMPNISATSDKVIWLNEINAEFFEVVKIPVSVVIPAVAGQAVYPALAPNARARNIDKVFVGNAAYSNFLFETVHPASNRFTFDDSTGGLTLTPAPVITTSGILRYFRISTTNYLVANIATDTPDAPPEFHWIYILGLTAYIARAMDDIGKANNYLAEFRAALQVAQQNFMLR